MARIGIWMVTYFQTINSELHLPKVREGWWESRRGISRRLAIVAE